MRTTIISKKRFFVLFITSIFIFIQGCDRVGSQKLNFKTEHQAVFLENGQIYFGKVELGSDYVTLSDVFYIQSQVNKDTNETHNILVKRGREWHGPDIMYINKGAIALIEPVSPDSQVDKLIKEAKSQKPDETK